MTAYDSLDLILMQFKTRGSFRNRITIFLQTSTSIYQRLNFGTKVLLYVLGRELSTLIPLPNKEQIELFVLSLQRKAIFLIIFEEQLIVLMCFFEIQQINDIWHHCHYMKSLFFFSFDGEIAGVFNQYSQESFMIALCRIIVFIRI